MQKRRKKARDYEKDLIQRLRDAKFAAEYLNASLEDEDKGSEERFLIALGHVAKAHGMTVIAGRSGKGRQALYRALSGSGNPELTTLKALLNSVGLRLSVARRQKVS